MKPATYSKLYIQIVFAVQNRIPAMNRQNRKKIFAYISGIITNNDNKSIIVNGTEDHIHILLGLNPKNAISDLVKEIKRCTTKYINENNLCQVKFSWQEGYGVFSYSRSQIDRVYNYILAQEEHHKKRSFKEEYIDLLNRFNIDYDERYLFKFE